MGKEIVVTCQVCGKKLKTDERFAGRKGKCPHCGASIQIVESAQPSGAPAGGGPVMSVSQLETREGALLRVQKINDVGVVDFTTSRILDQTNVQQLGEEFDELLDKHHLEKIVINFEKVNYMSSAVMGKLISLYKKLTSKGGQLRLCNISDNIYEIFEIMRFDKIFKICPNEDAAIVELMS